MLRRSCHLALIGTALLVGGCGSEPVEPTIERDAFIQTYADLRIAAVRTDSGRVADATRDSILAARGITEGDLTTFVDVHADDVDFMRDVWNEVELLMDREEDAAN